VEALDATAGAHPRPQPRRQVQRTEEVPLDVGARRPEFVNRPADEDRQQVVVGLVCEDDAPLRSTCISKPGSGTWRK
jgi:hypothetical protein